MIRTSSLFLLSTLMATVPMVSASGEERHPRRAPTLSAQAFGGVSAPYVRMAAVVDSGSGMVRSKGVSALRNPATGVYCVRSSSLTSATLATVVPMVTVDYTGSSRAGALAQFRDRSSSGNPCLSTEIAVMTYGLVNGAFVRVDDVGFTLLVP